MSVWAGQGRCGWQLCVFVGLLSKEEGDGFNLLASENPAFLLLFPSMPPPAGPHQHAVLSLPPAHSLLPALFPVPVRLRRRKWMYSQVLRRNALLSHPVWSMWHAPALTVRSCSS